MLADSTPIPTAADAAPLLARVAYDSTVKFNGLHLFNYWSLKQKLSIGCSEKFYKGDVVQLLHVSATEARVELDPTGTPPRLVEQCLLFISNNIPVPAEDDFKFTASGCRILLTAESVEDGNKIYSMLVLVPIDARAQITSNHVNGEQIVFDLRK